MRILIGEFPIGKTDAFDYECIQTKFLFIGFPLLPVASFYITPSEKRSAFFGDRDPDTANPDIWTRTPIPLHAKSIQAAYARWWGSGLVMFLLAYGGEPPWIGLVAALVWMAFFVYSWGTSARAKRERSALARATGVGAWPEIQYRESTQRVFDELRKTWRSRHEKTSGQRAWRKIAPADVDAGDLPYYYALCRYACVLEGRKWAPKTDAAWKRLSEMQVE